MQARRLLQLEAEVEVYMEDTVKDLEYCESLLEECALTGKPVDGYSNLEDCVLSIEYHAESYRKTIKQLPIDLINMKKEMDMEQTALYNHFKWVIQFEKVGRDMRSRGLIR